MLAGKYKILRLIGRGGMSEVYAVHHELLHQTVALKMLLPEVAAAPQATSRFINEARAAARIRGEHIATVMDVGTLPDGAAYMVLEYLEGQDLEEHAKQRGPLPSSETVDQVLEALQALSQAHAAGIVHRDLKPSNLFLARRPDGSSVVKVLDFGISKLGRGLGAVEGHSTASSAILGSPHYMAPEQARSAKSVDARADIWAVGVILYRLLAGEVPLTGDSLTELLLAIVQVEPRPLREHRPDLPEGLGRVVTRCLRKNPDERFANIAELAQALEPYGGPDAARAAQRISRTLAVTAATEPPPPMTSVSADESAATLQSVPKIPVATTPGPGTTASWADGSLARPRRVTGRAVASGATAALVVGAVAAGALVLRGRHPEPAAPAPGSAMVVEETPASVVPALTTMVIAAATPSTDAGRGPSATGTPRSGPSSPPPPAHRSPSSARPGPSAAPSAAASASPAATFNVLDQRN